MADVIDLPPENPILRDEKRRDRGGYDDRRRDNRGGGGYDDRRRDRDPRYTRQRRDNYNGNNSYHDREYKRRRSPSSSPPPPPPPPLFSHPSASSSSIYGHRSERSDRHRGSPPPPSGYKRSRREEDYGTDRREGLLSYKHFIAELEDDILPAEAERRYAEYKNEFISTQKTAFFEQNKTEDWLRDKYDPSRLEAVIQRRNESSRAAARQLLHDLESGVLDVKPNCVAVDPKEGQSVSDEDMDNRRRGRNSVKDQTLEAAPKAPGVFSEPQRIEKDVEQARALARKLDNEKGIEENILVKSDVEKSEGDTGGSGMSNPIVIIRGNNHVKGYEGVELLDVLLTYLWRVHYVDYYGSKEYKEQPKILRHVRGEGKINDNMSVSIEWEKKLDDTWKTRLQGKDPIELMLAKDKMEPVMLQSLEPFIRKIKDEKYGWKYGCGAKNCTKLFHGPEFVQKHLKLKHPEIVAEASVKVFEDLYFENYMSDPDAPGSTPVMLSQSDRSRRPPRPDEFARSSGLPSNHGGSWDVDKGSRDNEKIDNTYDGERFEKDDQHSPKTQDPQPGGGPFESSVQFEGGRADNAVFDPFNVPGMRGGPPPFGGDMAMPPVLMPVPGAGPLGPFVPAPPEVAMRLWREQGGAGSFHPGVYDGQFEGEGGSRGRNRGSSGNGRIGTGLIETPPMILPVSNMHQDSRRAIRSYRDLDAPEDEVTVIDYRSL